MAGKKKQESIGEYVDIDSLVEWVGKTCQPASS